MSSWWPVGRDGTSIKENGTHHGDKIRRPLQVKDGGKKARNGRESDGVRWKRGSVEAVEDYLNNCAHVKMDIEVLESLLEARKPGGLSKVCPGALNKKRKQYFPALRHIREAEPLRVNQKTMAREPRTNTVHGKRVGNTSGMMSSIKEQLQKPRRAPTRHHENAVAAAKLVISKRRRWRPWVLNLAKTDEG